MGPTKRMDHILHLLKTYRRTRSIKATACGKSYLACALGNHACAKGLHNLYFSLNRICEEIALFQADGTIIKWLDWIKKNSCSSSTTSACRPSATP